MNNKKKRVVLFLILLGIVVGGLFFVGKKTSERQNSEIKSVEFRISKGENILTIAENLKKEKILRSSWKFVWMVYKTGNQKKIKAGKYLLNNKLSVGDIVHIITTGDKSENEQVKITFPEGWTISQMAKKLNSNGFAGDEFISLSKKPKYFADKYGYDFLKSIPEGKDLQGFLFPDTYFFAKNSSAEDIIKKMLDNFKKKVNNDLRSEIKKQRKNLYEVITMASILEREVKSPEDKKIVSGIFWRRIKNGQALQSCATLAYILGENKKQYSYQDTKIQSPYNTYLHKGLPPGPISNPGLEAIMAAIYPTKTSYNYFLNNPKSGETVFSKTLREHNLNKIKNGL